MKQSGHSQEDSDFVCGETSFDDSGVMVDDTAAELSLSAAVGGRED